MFPFFFDWSIQYIYFVFKYVSVYVSAIYSYTRVFDEEGEGFVCFILCLFLVVLIYFILLLFTVYCVL